MPAITFNSVAVQELYDEVVGSDPSAWDEFEQELVNIEVAQLIHDMRTGAGLSQRTLAKKVGTSASAINRLESDDYQGHTIAMVRRIAAALNRRLELRAVPAKSTSVRTRSVRARPEFSPMGTIEYLRFVIIGPTPKNQCIFLTAKR